MSQIKEIRLPDVGGDAVEIIELCVAAGDAVEAEGSLITVETDKATMDVPSEDAGTVVELKVQVGDKVSEGDLIALVEVAGEAAAEAPAAEATPAETPAPAEPAPAPEAPAAAEAPVAVSGPVVKEVTVPDIGESGEVDIIEVLVAVGDSVEAEQGLITLETDKATMEVPAPFAGVVKELKVNVGDKIGEGGLVALIETQDAAPVAAEPAPAPAAEAPKADPAPAPAKNSAPPVPHHPSAAAPKATGAIYASPAVRRLASEFGVDLTKVKGTGRKNRILKEDVQAYVKYELSRPKASAATSTGAGNGLQVIEGPKVDFAKFGEVEEVPLTRIQKISGPNLHRNWVTIPHVTQFDEADITEQEAFRKEQNQLAAKSDSGVKITPLVFILKAAARALETHPKFNSSLSADGESLVMKKYIHIGVAVDTPNGLVVPVVRDVNKKGIIELSQDLAELSTKARQGKLTATDMQGSCFTISSLGGIGGTQFTPIVNAPDVAILGVSRSEMKPKWDGQAFQPRLMLPLAMSYDHRVIDGADAARFITTLSQTLGDIRRLIL
ncbi:pyruvate dehydrogenase complex dihydrolipoyllysine-residue acetyltransferase [Ferrimonas sp. YFM]|uniref:pyruvate dehydrogenase complex dihydrolipoyllysine-residue acetyltransferase n=1 Tax=Ferrimonas sp. YFM TaxID=3028878 RepID=UPI00257447EA|nr:pyruvate dehydrogenase complex dihydrolipoyllysine-residue acetyltransferase [Ferrimonas sp. YFM]BDY06654.1 acetyltransferase component of pyruvate dehydrogenase complex [Ferrimonas sp. YFM]